MMIGESILYYKCLLTSLMFFSLLSFGEEEVRVKEDKQTKEEILAKLDETKKLPISNFIENMGKINSEVDEYISIKEQECSGEYTSFTINEQGDKIFQKNKLTKKERKLCKYLLINFQIDIIKKSFEIRKEFLKRTHASQMNELLELQKKRLSELENTASKYK